MNKLPELQTYEKETLPPSSMPSFGYPAAGMDEYRRFLEMQSQKDQQEQMQRLIRQESGRQKISRLESNPQYAQKIMSMKPKIMADAYRLAAQRVSSRGAFDPTSPEFKKEYQSAMSQLLLNMKKAEINRIMMEMV
jgi:TolA-binding protein